MDKAFLFSGLLVAVGAFVLNAVRGIPAQLFHWLVTITSVQVEFPDHTPAFDWVDSWLADKKFIGGHRNVGVKVKTLSNTTVLELCPAPGSHYFFYKKHLVCLTRYRKEYEMRGMTATHGTIGKSFYENISLRLFFVDPPFLNELLLDAKSYHEGDEKKLSINTNESGYWGAPKKRALRDSDSVILADGVREDLFNDVDLFLRSKQWYHDRGIPRRRGYLLHGPPGNGKTSVIKAVASRHDMPIWVVSLSQRHMDDGSIQNLLDAVDENSVIVFEDIDCLAVTRDEQNEGVTLAGLLNALDGIASGEEYVLFMTTNHPEKLDPALTREGRVDKKIYIGNATPNQSSAMFKKFFPESPDHERFGKLFEDETRSMAFVQEHLLTHRDDPGKAIESLETKPLHLAKEGEAA